MSVARIRVSAGVAALAAAGMLVVACGSEPSGRPQPVGGDPGPIHAHGLGVNPKDGALFIATHTGLFRAAPDERTAARVGDRYQDTMGFTVVGADRFLGSGHPDGRDDLPPFLGLIRSDDAGRTWKPVSLLGKADFHVLEAAGDRVYGFGSDFDTRKPIFMVSRDGGETWQQRDATAPLAALAIDPDDPDSIVASTGRELLRSRDAGRSWRRMRGPGGLLAWPPNGVLAVVTPDGEVFARERGGAAFARRGDVGGRPAVFDSGGDALLVALHDGTVKRSDDGGRSWRVWTRPPG